jgi:multicomponent Na+:H+ antiporter subunit F
MIAIHEQVAAISLVWSLLLVLGFLLAAARAPSLLDTAIAVDALGLCLVGVLALIAARAGESLYLDAALALGLLAFAGTVAAARMLAPRGPPR